MNSKISKIIAAEAPAQNKKIAEPTCFCPALEYLLFTVFDGYERLFRSRKF